MSTGSLYAGRYRSVAQIGKGNFGQVFLVLDIKGSAESPDQKVMKRLAVNGFEADETMDVVHEARLMQKLEHPNIVRYVDSFLEGEFFCIVSEYCDQGDLHAYLSKLKEQAAHMQEQHILSWFAQLVTAVEHIHSRGVLHRDLKTKNVFIRQGDLKVGDFGISRILTTTNNVAQTFVGTPCYMSPEVFKHEDYGSKSDVWSLGCILVEMCTLTRAFDGSSLMDVMSNILQKQVPRLPSHYSGQLQSLADSILIREQSDRPSAADILRMDIVAQNVIRSNRGPTGATASANSRKNSKRENEIDVTSQRRRREEHQKLRNNLHEPAVANERRRMLEKNDPAQRARPSVRQDSASIDRTRSEQTAPERGNKDDEAKKNAPLDQSDEAVQDFSDIVDQLQSHLKATQTIAPFANEARSTAEANRTEEKLRADAERKLGQHFAAVYDLLKKARSTALNRAPIDEKNLQEALQKLVGFHLLPQCRLVDKLVKMELWNNIWARSPPHGTALTGHYSLARKPHGVCLIVNNYDYQNKMPARLGALGDEKAVYHTFKRLNFLVDVRRNLTAAQILDAIGQVSARLQNQSDECFACYVMAHGEETSVAGVDGNLVTLAAMLKPFDKQRRSAGKPIVFALELVRGKVPLERCKEETIQLPPDCFVVHRTVSLPKTNRRGLIFTRALCESLNRWASALDFESILNLVNDYFQRVTVDWSQPDSQTVKLVNAFTKQSSLLGLLNF